MGTRRWSRATGCGEVLLSVASKVRGVSYISPSTTRPLLSGFFAFSASRAVFEDSFQLVGAAGAVLWVLCMCLCGCVYRACLLFPVHRQTTATTTATTTTVAKRSYRSDSRI